MSIRRACLALFIGGVVLSSVRAEAGDSGAPPRQSPEIVKAVTDGLVEQVLGELKVEYKKHAPEGGATIYDLRVAGFAMRLCNFDGKDLKIAAGFRKITLEAINKYNVDRKFVRVVYYATPAERTALESNLDCAAGVTKDMVRHFITAFLPEVRDFAEYVAEQP
jgi:hypothetical protein